MGDAPRSRRSSRSWHLPPSQRRELYIARNLAGAVELLVSRAIAAGADSMPQSWRRDLEEDVHRIMSDAWSDAAEGEADLRSARDAERDLRHRMEGLLRLHGIPVPTMPRPSEPPGEAP